MNEQQAAQKLHLFGQQQLLRYWSELDKPSKAGLLAQIGALDVNTFNYQQRLLKTSMHPSVDLVEPLSDYARVEDIDNTNVGQEKIAAGQLGCLIVAGGQGTRLRFEGPKGMFPVTPVKHKSLFQLFAEKVKAAGKRAGRFLPLAVMTSPANHNETVAFFQKHALFGLDPDQLSIFPQGMLPLLNKEGQMFLEDKYTISEGPDGNGAALHHFYGHGIWDKWYLNGVRYLTFVLIDNALSDPFDAALLTYQSMATSDVAVKCTWRRDADEKVGILARRQGKVVVVEYTEMPEEQRKAVAKDGALLYPCANLSQFCFTMDFVKKVAVLPVDKMPLHRAFKSAKMLDAEGKPIQEMAWKYEKFIFDVLPFAERINALLYPRKECFAPLKNFNGEDSIDTVKAALQLRDREVFYRITGQMCTTQPFELSQEFHYPTEEMLFKWSRIGPPCSDYVEA